VKSSPSSWFSDAVLYHVFIDRFAGYDPDKDWQQPVFMGGNLKGIMKKADYIAGLGINTLWISPFYKTDAYHGYHITDFLEPDSRFGSIEDVRNLLEVFHQKNIRIIADFVPNHCSIHHPYFQTALHDRKSKYRKWFYFSRRNEKYITFLRFRELPKLNLDNPETRSHIIEAAKYWLSMGFDGFRLDHAIGPSHDFWKSFSAEIRKSCSNTVLIGEAWLEGIRFRHLKTLGIHHKYLRWLRGFRSRDLQAEYKNVLDGVLDFYFRHRITEYIAWKSAHEGFMDQLRQSMHDHYAIFSGGFYLPTFIDNHDMNRFIFDAGQNKDKLKAALAFQFSLPQPPIIYYGTETALSHTEAVNGHVPFSDLQARKPMPWNELDHEMIEFVKLQIAVRNRRKK
jgi:cyclomaltodextrinase